MRGWRVVAVALLLAWACTPRLQPPGDGAGAARLTEDAFITADGVSLPLRRWLPEGRARAALVAVHGMNDYSFAFAVPANYWRQRGIAVYAYDQRGFGGAPHRGLWPGVDVLAGDLRHAIRLVRARHPGVPVHLLGISMGGGVALAALAGPAPARVASVVLVAPAVWGRATLPAFYRATLWLAAHSVPWMTLSGRGLGRVASDNFDMLRALGRDPKFIKKTRVDTIYGLVNLMDRALAGAARVEVPVLILYGERDEIIPRKAVLRLVRRLPPARSRVAIYENGYHMLLRDLGASIVHQDVAAWVLDPGAKLPSGADRRDLDILKQKRPKRVGLPPGARLDPPRGVW